MKLNHLFTYVAFVVCAWMSSVSLATAQTLPTLQNAFRNVHTEEGLPTDPEDELGPRTPGQFQSATAFGGWVARRVVDPEAGLVAGSTNAGLGNAGAIVLPSFTPEDESGPLTDQTIQMQSVKVGRPMVLRLVSYTLGSEIPRPDRKPNGELLDPTIFAEAEFYLSEPENADTGKFYWSPHAQKVFASQPGRVEVVWKERISGDTHVFTYTIASSPVKPAKKIYWTEGDFNGPYVKIPTTLVRDVQIVYNSEFPQQVDLTESVDYDPNNPYNPAAPGSQLPPEERTLWHEADNLRAYNREGRIFVEFLGDLRGPENVYKEHLGFEIVDVVRQARPETLKVAIGELALPVDEAEMTTEDEELVAEVVAGLNNLQPYLHEHISLGGTKRDYYAIRETTPLIILDLNNDGVVDALDEQQSNEVLIYWKEEGVSQIEWPKSYVGYIFKWPEDYDENPSQADLEQYYSLYARPEDNADAAFTGVQLNSADNPFLAYQDDSTEQHAIKTPQNVFYTTIGTGNRSLIRYTNGDAIWFERVYSIQNSAFDGYGSLENATVGARINPPSGIDVPAGYIRPTSGDAYNVGAYINPFVSGFEDAADGAIIPVNALANNDVLEVWWYKESNPPNGSPFSRVKWPSLVKRYSLNWPVTDENDANLFDEIVLARNDGSGELGIAASGSIYRQPDPALPGYNPNEEHALMSGGVAWALRDDLNVATSSEPYVLVDYTAEDGRPAMVIRRVVRENNDYSFDYEVPVGVVLQAPMPLPILPLPYVNGVSKNREVGTPSDLPNGDIAASAATRDNHYDKFTIQDRKGATWIYRGVHDLANEGNRGFEMQYFYNTQAEFDFPGLTPPAVGTVVPYLRPGNAISGYTGDAITGDPINVRFTPIWPGNAPVLNIAETLGLPKRGLPAVQGQTSAQIIYEQSIASDISAQTRSARLFDPTRAKVYPLSATGLDALPSSVETSLYQGKTYFPQLPPHLSQRLYFDPTIGELGALVFIGEFVDAALGEDYYYLNVMSDKDVLDAKNLAAAGADTKWNSAIDGLATTLETFVEDPTRSGVYIPQSTSNQTIGVQQLAEVEDDDIAVDSYALAAVGGGSGYVVMATGNGEAFTPEGEPVSLHVFKVAPPLYRGELKVIASANPLDEKLTLRHVSDFAGDPSDYEFAWLSAQPVSGLPPELYTFDALEVLSTSGRSWRLLNNPDTRSFITSHTVGFDDSGWDDPGDLGANPIVIDDGLGGNVHGDSLPFALLREEFTWSAAVPIDLYLSLDLAENDGVVAYINGVEVAVKNVPNREDTVPATAPGVLADEVLDLVYNVEPTVLQNGGNTVVLALYTNSDSGTESAINVRLDSQQETANLSGWLDLTSGAKAGQGEVAKMSHTIEGSSILTLTDNYFTLRYRAKAGTEAAAATGGGAATPGEWSRWMPPQLAEGWIKRALAGINPFNQRITDLFNNTVNTDVSLVAQAGTRWEGDIALNLENIDDFGLIEIYETILRRGRGLSISGAPALNVPAANDALLLAAGYLNDLYMILGNEAYADAANPTIAYSTEGGSGISAKFGDVSTSLFAFKGQFSSVLEEELALLRGRDDSFQPGVTVQPIYNKIVWNFTNGIDSGEAVYALNYNIKDVDSDGDADAADAATQYPQGHGDAYGHYLTALKGYYSLLNNPNFGWTPRIEAVSVLGQPVSIDYQDERKFAAAAAAVASTASLTLDLTYRKEFISDENVGWEHLTDGQVNAATGVTRSWGTDEWACRGGQGAYFNWVVANSILPEEDLDPTHEGIEVVERSTVPELDQLVAHADAIQQRLSEADSRLNPLGLAKGAVSFDISPSEIDAGNTHYEQVYQRALTALGNAKFAFDQASDSTRLLREQEDTLEGKVYAIESQETAYNNALVELYGTPYSDDIGPGRTYVQGYAGPDLLHYGYVDEVELFFKPSDGYQEVTLPVNPAFAAFSDSVGNTVLNYDVDANGVVDTGASVKFSFSGRGDLIKPASWTGRRSHPGQIQAAISDLLTAKIHLHQAGINYQSILDNMKDLLSVYRSKVSAREDARTDITDAQNAVDAIEAGILAANIIVRVLEFGSDLAGAYSDAVVEFFPKNVGTSPDVTSTPRGAARITGIGISSGLSFAALEVDAISEGLGLQINRLQRQLELDLEREAWSAENQQLIRTLHEELTNFANERSALDAAIRSYDQKQQNYYTLVARGDQIQRDREVFRKRSAAIIQGYRTRDFAFRVFRNESLEKYKTLFNLAAKYTYLAAKAYDYETGLLDISGSSQAANFFNSISQSRALGVIDSNGDPQFGASDTGDPGLAGILAQMQGDWAVAKTRLGFNNPDNYRTTFSLRNEGFRIVSGSKGDAAWQDKLTSFAMRDILDDPDVKRYCLQADNGDGLAVPGLVIPFQTTIADGVNFFGRALAGGDHTYSPTSFTTKIRSSGIGFEGYVGMTSESSTSGSVGEAGGESPSEPDTTFLDEDALSATPYIYFIPVGVDSMRSPPIGDSSVVRTWSVDDQAIPLPFNIGLTDFTTDSDFVAGDSLSENVFSIRKHQAFRAVPSGSVYSGNVGFTNSRLIGRSAWNSQWKIVIPARTLHANPNLGMQTFLRTVTDIELFLETYSYSGN